MVRRMTRKSKNQKLLLSTVVILFVLGSQAVSVIPVWGQTDSDNDGVPDFTEEKFAIEFFPILIFTPGEQFFPTSIEYHLDNAVLMEKIDDTDVLILNAPSSSNINQYQGEGYYLKNMLETPQAIANDYQQWRETGGYDITDVVYVRVRRIQQNYVIQYWLFYAFNPGQLNSHQGDWELVQIVLDLDEQPEYAVYSQHFSGEKAAWTDIEKEGNHPKVYVALGSHANYFRPYQGKVGLENDVVGSDIMLKPEDVALELLGEAGSNNHEVSQNWLDYGGRWGDWKEIVDIARGSAGPTTPGFGENADRWHAPIAWGLNTFAVNQNWFILSWVMFNFIYIFAAVVASISAWKIWKIYKHQKKGKLVIKHVLQSRAVIGLILAIAGIVIYVVAILSPWYIVQADIQTTALKTVGETDLMILDGVKGLQINTLEADRGMTQLFGIGIPFAIILVIGVVFNVLDIIGVEKVKKLSKKYLKSGFTTLIPVLIIIIFIILLASILPIFAGSIGQEAVTTEIQTLADRMSAEPIGGRYRSDLGTYGSADISWGLGIGAYLFIVSAIVKLVAGIVLLRAKEPTPSTPPPPPPPR